ncbi:MAG: PP2C family protein-serine/threonine phosphatase [Planctomycetota bacterium]
MACNQQDGPISELIQIADALVGVESGRELLRGLERLLRSVDALPARLYLVDDVLGQLYLGACIEGEDDGQELPVDLLSEPEPGQYPLLQHGDPVGLLCIDAPKGSYPSDMLQRLAVLLGPALAGVQQHELTLGELRQVHEQRQLLLSTGNLLRHLDIEVLLVRILETVLTAVSAQVGAILTAGSDGILQPRVAWGIQDHHVDAILLPDGRRLVDVAFAEQTVFCLSADEVGERLDCRRLEARLDGILLLPMASSERCHGVVLLANPSETFDEGLRRLGETVCGMGAIALDNLRLVQATLDRERLHRELDIATRVQANMFPEDRLTVPGVQIAGASRPCEETGGDYYTYMHCAGWTYAVVADVTGHGLGAALYTTMAHAVIQQQLRAGTAIADAASGVSAALRYSNSERFMTAAIIAIDAQRQRFHYVSAGHNPLLWLHADGTVEWLESNSLPLGILVDAAYEQSPYLGFRPGDCLVLYTDGFIEAVSPDGEQYGEDRFCESVQEALAHGCDPAGVIQVLDDRVRGWLAGAEPADDLTAVVLYFGDEAPEIAAS